MPFLFYFGRNTMEKNIKKNTKALLQIINDISSITHKREIDILREAVEVSALFFSSTITPHYETKLPGFEQVTKNRLLRLNSILEATPKNISNLYTDFLNELIKSFSDCPYDYLGELINNLSGFSSRLGQFMTPGNVADLMNEISIASDSEGEVKTINDPACGTGGLAISIGKTYLKKGINYQPITQVFCSDIDFFMVQCTYVQLCLMGFEGSVIHSDTLKGAAFSENEMWILPYSVIDGKKKQIEKKNEHQFEELKKFLSGFLNYTG